MNFKSILGKLRLLFNLALYASIGYAGYRAYLEYQIGGLDRVLSWFYALPTEVLMIIVVAGAAVLVAVSGQ